MKKLVLLATAVTFSCVTFSALGQSKKPAPAKMPVQTSMSSGMSGPTSQGKWLVGATVGLYSGKSDNAGVVDKTTSYGILPSVSYFVKDDLALGLMFGIGGDKLDEAGTAFDKSSFMLVAPTARYYMPIGERFKFYTTLSVPIGSKHITLSAGNDVDIKRQSFGVQVRPGFAFFPSKKISVEMNIGAIYFQSSKVNDFTETSMGVTLLGNDLVANADFQAFAGPQLGVKFHLGH